MLEWFATLVVGFASQIIDGTLGMGFGATSSSILLSIGLSPVIVSASVHIGKVFSNLVSGVSHHAFGNVDRRLVLRLTGPGVVGGAIGATLLSSLDPRAVVPAIACILLFMGVRIFVRFSNRRAEPLPGPRFGSHFPDSALYPLGFTGGLIDAFGGAGWGPICMASLAGRTRREVRVIVGSVNMAEFFVALAIVTAFALNLGVRGFDMGIAGPLIIGGIIAAPLAAYLTTRISTVALGSLVGLFLVLVNVWTISNVLPGTLGFPRPFEPSVALLAAMACLAAYMVFMSIYARVLTPRKRSRHRM